ncbi:MAG: tRNA (adenosine(37)-N6)-threonylcarbamoyltransferase complex dimerization subunit type 1 TsaB [Sphingobacteriales bacterium]|nr:MAG: tRNA (adenosine(37)-N6)-threonylcarbamoyltransferase complex dimerization subunit type 1 TsaB [Sphingobacteriales bacterium]
MSGLQLHINTALDKAYIAVSLDGQILGYMENLQQKEHASFLQPAIKDILVSLNKKVRELSSISAVYGPGSYTGLRVGLAAAKGICYACQIPLICISTLEWLAVPHLHKGFDCIIPMIDARRMEVFTAAFNNSLQPLLPSCAMVLDDNSFSDILPEKKTMFTGNGAFKVSQHIRDQYDCESTPVCSGAEEQVVLAKTMFEQRLFADLVYAEPYYLKAFFTTANI